MENNVGFVCRFIIELNEFPRVHMRNRVDKDKISRYFVHHRVKEDFRLIDKQKKRKTIIMHV